MARKQLDYKITDTKVSISLLAYADQDAEPTVVETVEFDVTEVPATLKSGEDSVASLAAYGLSQILQDRVSSVQGGKEKLEAMAGVFEMLKGGEWKAARASTAGERKAAIPSDFAEGFARFVTESGRPMDATTATIFLQSKSADERKALRAHEGIKAKIAEVKAEAESKAADLDLDSLLG